MLMQEATAKNPFETKFSKLAIIAMKKPKKG